MYIYIYITGNALKYLQHCNLNVKSIMITLCFCNKKNYKKPTKTLSEDGSIQKESVLKKDLMDLDQNKKNNSF